MFTIKYIKTDSFKMNFFQLLSFFIIFIRVNVKEYLWKCMHAKIGPFQYIKVCKQWFALMFLVR